MPKIKKSANDENKFPNKMARNKKYKSGFKFDMKRILKERQAESEFLKKHADLDKEMKVVNDLFREEVNNAIDHDDSFPLVLPKVGYVIFDRSKCSINFEDNPSSIGFYSQQLLLMSVVKSELEANIIFNNLMTSNWSPVFEVC